MATVGRIDLRPNLVNVVPATATITVDLRNTDEDVLVVAERALAGGGGPSRRRRERVAVTSRSLARFQPVEFDPATVDLVEATAQRLGYSTRRLPSGAGHDAQMLARVCPTAMIFTPSVDGLSHNIAEYTAPDDVDRRRQRAAPDPPPLGRGRWLGWTAMSDERSANRPRQVHCCRLFIGMPVERRRCRAARRVLASSSIVLGTNRCDIRKEWCPECLSLVKSRQIDHVSAPAGSGLPPARSRRPAACSLQSQQLQRCIGASTADRLVALPLVTTAAPWGSKPRQTLPNPPPPPGRSPPSVPATVLFWWVAVHSPRHQPQRRLPRHRWVSAAHPPPGHRRRCRGWLDGGATDQVPDTDGSGSADRRHRHPAWQRHALTDR